MVSNPHGGAPLGGAGGDDPEVGEPGDYVSAESWQRLLAEKPPRPPGIPPGYQSLNALESAFVEFTVQIVPQLVKLRYALHASLACRAEAENLLREAQFTIAGLRFSNNGLVDLVKTRPKPFTLWPFPSN
jgi:hypothetical protein